MTLPQIYMRFCLKDNELLCSQLYLPNHSTNVIYGRNKCHDTLKPSLGQPAGQYNTE